MYYFGNCRKIATRRAESAFLGAGGQNKTPAVQLSAAGVKSGLFGRYN